MAESLFSRAKPIVPAERNRTTPMHFIHFLLHEIIVIYFVSKNAIIHSSVR